MMEEKPMPEQEKPAEPVEMHKAAEPAESADAAQGAVAPAEPKAEQAESTAVTEPEVLPEPSVEDPEREAAARVHAESRRYTRRSFGVASVSALAGYGFYHWIANSPGIEMQPELLRRAMQTNAALSRAIYDERGLAPTYPLKRAETLRINGVYGLKRALVPESWRLQVVGVRGAESSPRFTRDVTAWEYLYSEKESRGDQGHDTKVPPPSAGTAAKMSPAPMLEQQMLREDRVTHRRRGQEEAGMSRSTLAPGTPGLLLTLQDILALPRHELVTQFKCIEGWSQIVHWAGVRMADFLEAYPPALIDGKEPKYVYMETPDGDYYTGYDMNVCRHPQTLLVTEMMGAPLEQYHGAPLRLHMPTKYGYKQIKRIGLISYTNEKPDDYWTRLGYDWYAGL